MTNHKYQPSQINSGAKLCLVCSKSKVSHMTKPNDSERQQAEVIARAAGVSADTIIALKAQPAEQTQQIKGVDLKPTYEELDAIAADRFDRIQELQQQRDDLQRQLKGLIASNHDLKQRNHELLAASKTMLAFHEREHEQFNKSEPEVNALRAAIAAADSSRRSETKAEEQTND